MSEKRVSVRLRAEGGGQVRAEFEGVGHSGERAYRRIGERAEWTGRILRRVMGFLAAGISLQQLNSMTQSYTQIGNALRVTGVAAEDVSDGIARLGAIAQRTRSPLEAMAQLFQRVSMASTELGANQAQILRFTENIGLALAQQGGSAEQASGALLQLSQALGSGTVRAEEFNSILEGAFPIAQAAARGIDEAGGSVARLRQLVIDGEVSSERFFAAILSQTEELERTFAETDPTISQAFGNMRTAMVLYLGETDRALGASAALASGILLLADNIDILVSGAIGLGIVVTGRWLISLGALRALMVAVNATFAVTGGLLTGGVAGGLAAAANATLAWRAALVALRGALILTGFGALVVGAGVLVHLFTQLVRGSGGFGNALQLLGDLARATFAGMGNVVRAWGDGFRAITLDLEATWTRFVGYLAQKWADFLGMIAPTWNGVMERLGVDLEIDALGAEAYASALEHAAESRASLAEEMRRRERDGLATAFDETREAWAALLAAMEAADDGANGGMEDALASAEDLAAALREAGEAGGRAGRQSADGADEAAQGWKRVSQIMSKYATESMDWASNLGGGIVNAFRSAENALGDFVRTGKVDFRGLVQSILADMAQIAARQFIFGPLLQAFSGLLGGIGGGGGGKILSGTLGAAAPALAGGAAAGLGGALAGGLDGMGGQRALAAAPAGTAAPTRGGTPSRLDIGFDRSMDGFRAQLRDENGQLIQEAFQHHDRHVLPDAVQHIIRNPREKN
ncbi:MAG: Lambda phage tail tape-measure protein [Rhodobacteraceae bacterium HLUCCA12]|nr:MAG: Lambda phage tail tape-measure protein [Rhodobacteraceae bacterium HLUCCA12]